MSAWLKVGLPLSFVGVVAVGAGAFSTSAMTACSSSNNSSSSGGSGGSSSGSCAPCPGSAADTSNGGNGTPLTPGTFPDPTCCISAQDSCGTATTCKIDTTTCGSTDPGQCEALADNTKSTTWNYRIRRLNIIAPPSLANTTVQNSVVSKGVDLNLASCGEKGDGTFTWLLQVDSTNNTLKTGGAPLVTDPLGTGYCFVDTKVNAGTPNEISVGPATVSLTKNADGTYDSATIPTLNIPIYYLSGSAPAQIIVLPINGGAIHGMKITQSGNCIGSFDSTALDSQCADKPYDCAKWLTAGSLGGYITLAQADKVQVPLLGNKSLCVLMTGQAGSDLTCTKNGDTYVAKGDYCSTSGKAGDCADAFWLAADFAASAIKINDGTGVADCNGGSSSGSDAGSSSGSGDASPE